MDERFADKIVMPGFIEAYAHVSAGGVWRFTYCGHYPRTDPDGKIWDGVENYDALIDRLRKQIDKTPIGQPIVGWGFDSNFLEGRRLERLHLDQVSIDHPVAIVHSNFHLLSANTIALSATGLLKNSNIEGVLAGPDGIASGELQEFAAMDPIMEHTAVSFKDLSDASAVQAYGKVARNCGVTTVADLLADLDEPEVEMLEQVTASSNFPIRYVPIMNAMVRAPQEEAKRAIALRVKSTDKLHLGRAKLFTDGAIQAFTAKLKNLDISLAKTTVFGICQWIILRLQLKHFIAQE